MDKDEAKKMEKETENELLQTEKKTEVKSEDDDDVADGSDSDSDLSDSDYVCSVCSKKFSGFIPFSQHEKGSKHAKALLKKQREKKLRNKIKEAEKVVEEDEEYLFFIKKPVAVCKPCSKQFGDEKAYHLHLISKAHKQKIIQSSILDKVRENGEINVDMLKELYKTKKVADNPDDLLEDAQERIAYLNAKDENDEATDEFECKDCEKSFTGLVPYTQHLMSKIHAKKVEQKKLFKKLIPGTSEDLQKSGKSKPQDVSTLVVEDDVLVCKLCSTSFSGPESAMIHLKSRKHSKNLEDQIRKMKRRQKAATAKLDDSSEEDSDDKFEDTSDSENKTEDKVLSETASQEPKRSSASENVDEEKKNGDSKDKDNHLLQYQSYKSYKKVMHQANDKNKDT